MYTICSQMGPSKSVAMSKCFLQKENSFACPSWFFVNKYAYCTL